MDYYWLVLYSVGLVFFINDIGIFVLSVFFKFFDNCLFWFVVVIGGLLIFVFVFYFQYVCGFVFCLLCIFICLDVFGLVFVGIVGSFVLCLWIVGGIVVLGMFVVSLGGIYYVWLLVVEEKLVVQGMGSCKMFMGFFEWILLDIWLLQVFQFEGLCGEVVWILFGQFMVVWLLVLFVFCLLVLVVKLVFGCCIV